MAKKRKEENEKKEENLSLGTLGFSHSYAISPAMRVCCMIYIASLQFLFDPLSFSTIFHRFQKQAHWAKLLPDYNLRATCHRVFTQMFHQLTRIAIWSHCSPVNIISWELPSMIFTPQPNITQFYRGQFYYIKEYSYCMPGSIHVYCILGSLKREISLEFESYISQWHCRIQVIWSA